MPGIASAATAVVLAHAGAATTTIRVGAGGIMLPNHAPLTIAEQFGTLDALFPGRVDLGLGRAPGTDPVTMRALRRTLTHGVDSFPDDVRELLEYFDAPAGNPVQAVPGAGAKPEVWMLGSSTYGAQLAAALGLPYAFASHFAPADLEAAVSRYRAMFRPSPRLAKAHVMLGVNAIVAEREDDARLLASSLMQAFLRLRTGRPGKLPRPIPNYEASLSRTERALLASVLSCSFVGTPDQVRAELATFAERAGADELIVVTHVHDQEARRRSYELLMGDAKRPGTNDHGSPGSPPATVGHE